MSKPRGTSHGGVQPPVTVRQIAETANVRGHGCSCTERIGNGHRGAAAACLQAVESLSYEPSPLARGSCPKEAAQFASAVAPLSVTRRGALPSLATQDEVTAFFAAHSIAPQEAAL